MENQLNTEAIIRVAAVDDANSIAEIYNHYVRSGGATFDAIPWTHDQVVEVLNTQPPELWSVSMSSDRMLGWASARRFSLRHGYRTSMESAIYLTPDAVGRGVADRLQEAIMQRCRDSGIHHLMARIIAGNHRSMAFHYRHGYQLVGIQNEVGHMDDQWVDVAILQRIIE